MKTATQSVSRKDTGAQQGQGRPARVAAASPIQGNASDAREAQADHAANQLRSVKRWLSAPAAAYVVAGRSAPLQRKCACGSGKASRGGTCSDCESRTLQTKLSIGASDDQFEQEADRVADQVLAAPVHSAMRNAPPRIQRFTGPAPGQADAAPASVNNVLAGPGRSLDSGLRQDMEQRFGHDFSQVRVHSGTAAEQSARDVNAHAYTVGNNIVFDAGQFAPATQEGRRLIAHELTHVVQQSAAPGILRRRSTFGAGGCALSPSEEDENADGPRGTGMRAHTQIQSFLTPRVLNEIEIPRATKTRIDNHGCQNEGVRAGFADLVKRGGLANEIAEIKPIGSARNGLAVQEARHYVRRAEQSMDRTFGTGTCGPPGTVDDPAFVARIGAFVLRPTFGLLDNVLLPRTVIGPFDGDRSRTLKAESTAPGAVGYWCTGGASDTYTCGSSEQETRAFIDRIALGPAQELLETFIRNNIERRLEAALSRQSLGDLIRLGERHFGAQIRQMLRPYLGRSADLILNRASAQQIAQLIESAVGPEARSIVTTLVRRISGLIITELRVQLRNVLAEIVRDALAALCVGAPAVALSELLDKVRELMRERTRVLIPVIVSAIMVQATAMLVAEIGAMLSSMASALGEALSFVADIVLRVLAAVLVLLLIVGAIIAAIVAFVLIFDPVPGDEVFFAGVAAAAARLVPEVGRFVWTGGAFAH